MCAARPLADRDRRQQFELGLRFDIDAENAFVDREREFARGLADAGEHDLVGGHAGRARALELAFRHHVGAGAELGQRRDHRLVGIRLHGVADQRAHVGEGAGEHLVVPLQRRGRIAIERRADAVGERVEVHRLGVQHAVAIGEVMHRALLRRTFRDHASVSRREGIRFFGPLGASGWPSGPTPGLPFCAWPPIGVAARFAHQVRHVRLRLARERGAGRRIERTLAAARGQAERRGQRADQGETEKRAVDKSAQERAPWIERTIANQAIEAKPGW